MICKFERAVLYLPDTLLKYSASIPFYGYNLFLVLTLYTDSIEIEKKEELLSLADYLLANKVSPLAVDRDRE